MTDQKIADFKTLLREAGIELEISRRRIICSSLHHCDVTIKDCQTFCARGAGFSQEEAESNAMLRLFADLEFNLTAGKFHLPSASESEPGDNLTRRFDCDESGLLFDEALVGYYELDGYEPESFADTMTWDGQFMRADAFVSVKSRRTAYLPSGWLRAVFGPAAATCAKTREEAANTARGRAENIGFLNSLITSPYPLEEIPEDNLSGDFLDAARCCAKAGFTLKAYAANNGPRGNLLAALFRQHDHGVFIAPVASEEKQDEGLLRALEEILSCDPESQTAPCHQISAEYSKVLTPNNLTALHTGRKAYLPVEIFLNRRETAAAKESPKRPSQAAYMQLYSRGGLWFCRYIMPGVSEIGDPAAFDATSQSLGNIYRSFLLSLANNLDDVPDFLESAVENGLEDRSELAPLLGICCSSDHPFASLTLAELKALISMAQQDDEAALCWIENYLENCPDTATQQKKNFYSLCRELIRIRLDNENVEEYSSLHKNLYDRNTLHEARRATGSCHPFWNYHLDGGALEHVPEHRIMEDIHLRYRKLKAGLPEG
ncbi:MAG: hypothetical protein IJ523_08160 [Succinivibrionaceae bacterium]|nr:hypothetical protein [Succinivibrionaceae bacterium]